MSPDNPFLRALLAQPDDDTLRLAMADWLDENDQSARAEFIRVQIELARGVEDRDRRSFLERRQAELLTANDREWVRPLLEVLDGTENSSGGWSFDSGKYDARYPWRSWGGCVFRRGFVEYFHLPAPVVNRHGEKLSRLTPVRELYLCPCPLPDNLLSMNIVWLCKKSWLRSVVALYIAHARLNANAVRALIACPHLTNLRTLDVVALTGDDVSEDITKEYFKRFGRHLVRSPHA